MLYLAERFDWLRSHGVGEFDPGSYGLNPAVWRTSLHKGWHGEFEVRDSLRLTQLHVQHRVDGVLPVLQRRVIGPAIGGVVPQPSPMRCNSWYRDIDLHVALSGGVLIGRDYCLQSGSFGGGLWRYGQVYELLFKRGRLIEALDRSSIVAEVRDHHLEVSGSSKWPVVTRDPQVRERIAASFAQPYRLF